MKPIDIITGGQHSKNIAPKVCNSCGQPVGSFKDTLSEKEYQISGFCQKCQDKIFGN